MNGTNILATQIGILIGNYAGVLIENYIIVDFLVKYFGYKSDRKNSQKMGLATWIILSLLSQGNGSFHGSTYLLPIIAIVLLCSYCHVYLNGRITNQLLCCLTPFLIISVINPLILQLSSILFRVDVEQILETSSIIGISLVLFTKLIFFVCMQSILLIFKRKYLILLKNNWITVVIVLITSLLINFGLYYLTITYVFKDISGQILVGISFGILIMDVYIYWSVLKNSELNQHEMEFKLLCLQNEEQANQIKNLAEHENRLSQVRHDFKNHLLAIQSLIDNNEYTESRKYIQNLTDKYLMEVNSTRLCNNIAVNAVLVSKLKLCKNYNILCRYNIIGDFHDFDGVDLSIIIFNLMDNAIEASLNLKRNRLISLEMKTDKDYIIIKVKNFIEKSVLQNNPELETTKLDEGSHGLGHISINEVVQKHDGMIDYYEEKSMFCVYIMLKNNK